MDTSKSDKADEETSLHNQGVNNDQDNVVEQLVPYSKAVPKEETRKMDIKRKKNKRLGNLKMESRHQNSKTQVNAETMNGQIDLKTFQLPFMTGDTFNGAPVYYHRKGAQLEFGYFQDLCNVIASRPFQIK